MSRFEILGLTNFQRTRPDWKIESFHRAAKQKTKAALVCMFFVSVAILQLKPLAAFIRFVLVKKFNRFSFKRTFTVVVRREKSMN